MTVERVYEGLRAVWARTAGKLLKSAASLAELLLGGCVSGRRCLVGGRLGGVLGGRGSGVFGRRGSGFCGSGGSFVRGGGVRGGRVHGSCVGWRGVRGSGLGVRRLVRGSGCIRRCMRCWPGR